MDKNKRIKLLALLIYTLIALLLVLLTAPNYLISIIIVFGPPSIVNFLWLKNSRTKILIFSLLSALLFAPPVELMARLLNIWDVSSIFARPFGLIPLENMLFAWLNFFWVLCFYEYFIANDQKTLFNKKFKYLIALYLIFATTIYSLYFYNPQLIAANYITIAIITLIIPGFLIFYRRLKLLRQTIIPTLFFALVFFLSEIVSLKIGVLSWPGQDLSLINFGGQIFPLEDVIIWYFLSTPVLIGGYEFFLGNNKQKLT